MELGMIGLGRMGANMTERLLLAGHRMAVYDIDSSAVQRAAALGAIGSPSIEALVRALKPPRAIWLMVPAGEVVETTLNELESFLQEGNIAVDGGNSNYKDTIRRAETLIKGNSLCGRGNQRRHLGTARRLLPHDRWVDGGC